MGGEFWWGIQDISFALRAGFSFNDLYQDLGGLSGVSLGAGVKYQDWELDYALVPFGDLGNTQRFSITFMLESTPLLNALPPPMSVQVQTPQADFKTGAVKQATFYIKPMARTEIKNWTLEITDPKGNILRSYSGKGVPPREIAWDGKDASGNVVTGGIFSNYNLRTVDTRGQQVQATEPLFRFSPQEVSERRLKERVSESTVSRKFPIPQIPPEIHPLGLSGVVKIPGVSFEEGSANLSPDYYHYLEQVAQLIRRYPEARVYLEGHADVEGTEEQCLRLSQYRANAVMRYLVEKLKVEPSNLYARGRNTSNSLDVSGTEVAHLRNRRVDIIILTK
jgi:outer membrane protein OmpA-like peptidoglycan-associated protein